jgi:hypothetical protein
VSKLCAASTTLAAHDSVYRTTFTSVAMTRSSLSRSSGAMLGT